LGEGDLGDEAKNGGLSLVSLVFFLMGCLKIKSLAALAR